MHRHRHTHTRTHIGFTFNVRVYIQIHSSILEKITYILEAAKSWLSTQSLQNAVTSKHSALYMNIHYADHTHASHWHRCNMIHMLIYKSTYTYICTLYIYVLYIFDICIITYYEYVWGVGLGHGPAVPLDQRVVHRRYLGWRVNGERKWTVSWVQSILGVRIID